MATADERAADGGGLGELNRQYYDLLKPRRAVYQKAGGGAETLCDSHAAARGEALGQRIIAAGEKEPCEECWDAWHARVNEQLAREEAAKQ